MRVEDKIHKDNVTDCMESGKIPTTERVSVTTSLSKQFGSPDSVLVVDIPYTGSYPGTRRLGTRLIFRPNFEDSVCQRERDP